MTNEVSKNLVSIVQLSDTTAKDSNKTAGLGAALLDISLELTELMQRIKVN